MALRPRLSPGVPLSREGSVELRFGAGAVKRRSQGCLNQAPFLRTISTEALVA